MADHDVVVAGGGPSGVAAAVAAARQGREVALLERASQLGGAGTTNLVPNFINAYWDGERYLIGGYFMELRHRLIGRKALYQTRGPYQEAKHGQEPFDPEAYADELAITCREAGVDLRLGTTAAGVEGDGERVEALALADGSRVTGRVFVDATGDAVLAAHAGVPVRDVTPDDDERQPLTYTYVVGPVDLDALAAAIPEAIMHDANTGARWADCSHLEPANERVREAIAADDLDLPVTEITSLRSVPGRPECFAVNLGYVQVDDPTDEEQLAEATEAGKEQMREGVAFLRDYLPGFGDVEVVEEPERIGVRQSRQIEGLYQLTGEDVLGHRQLDDVVCQSCFPIDIHRAEGDWEWDEEQFPPGTHYDVPWRTLIPRSGPGNVLVVGRSLSADHAAFSSVRVSPSVMALGEAGGVTAALAAGRGEPVADVGAGDVQRVLRETRAVLE